MRWTDDTQFIRFNVDICDGGIVIVITSPTVIVAGVGRLGRLCIGRLARVRVCFEVLKDLLSCLPILNTVFSFLYYRCPEPSCRPMQVFIPKRMRKALRGDGVSKE